MFLSVTTNYLVLFVLKIPFSTGVVEESGGGMSGDETGLRMVNTQCNIQMLRYRLVHLRPVKLCQPVSPQYIPLKIKHPSE